MTKETFKQLVSNVLEQFMETFFQYKFNHFELIEIPDDQHFDNVIFISLFGGIEGNFVLEIDNSTAEKFLNTVHMNINQEMDLAQFVKGYFGEFSNILASKIAINLGKNFGNTFFSTPSLFTGTGLMVDTFSDKNYSTVLDCDFGLIKINFSLRN